MGGNDSTEISRVISVLAFYVFSCSCLHGSRKETNAELKQTAWMWREEIENGPSLLRRTSERPSERSSSFGASGGASTPHSLASARSMDLNAVTDTKPEKHSMIADFKSSNNIPPIPPIPKIHPPVNERHPPVVSALPQLNETLWMVMPPPTARAMENLNRQINAQRSRSGSGSGASLESAGLRPGSAETGRTPPRYLPLEMENLMDGTRQTKRPIGRRRVRYQDDVLEDMDDGFKVLPSTNPSTRASGDKPHPSRPKSSFRRFSRSKFSPLSDDENQQSLQLLEQIESNTERHFEMLQLPPVAVLSPLGLPDLGKFGFEEEIEQALAKSRYL